MINDIIDIGIPSGKFSYPIKKKNKMKYNCAARWRLRRLNLPTSSRRKRVVKEKTQQLFV